MKKDIKSLLLIITCTIILFLAFYFPNIIIEKENAYNFLSAFAANVQKKEEIIFYNFEINYKMTGLISPNILYTSTKGDIESKFLSELVRNKPLLFYRYADVNCNICYETEIKALQEAFVYTPELTGILCSYIIERDLINFKRLNVIKLSMYRIDSDAFNWEVEQNGNPYYFVLHPDMKISHIYVPNKDYPALNKQYLEGVKRFLQDEN